GMMNILPPARIKSSQAKCQSNLQQSQFFRGVEDERKIVILESYQTAEDFDLHRQTQHFLTIGAVHIIPELEARTVSTFVTANSPAEAP
ncbi:hypothetical protein SB659_17740, partial [Arthrobacter sp. SIMBA_036]|uniref:putative quinol monooxygenase n=1 Tax=Arthrobacter sp. SIMBA_036 TaxID=3085778 RepID=UPI00397D2DDB